jgi:hypothetical protein
MIRAKKKKKKKKKRKRMRGGQKNARDWINKNLSFVKKGGCFVNAKDVRSVFAKTRVDAYL